MRRNVRSPLHSSIEFIMFSRDHIQALASRIKSGMNCRVFLFGSYAWGVQTNAVMMISWLLRLMRIIIRKQT